MKNFGATVALLATIAVSVNTHAQIQDVVPNHDTFTIDSKKVNETRTINVWLPNEYQEGTKSFPVLYMPDGGVKEDFPHVANTLSELIRDGKIPPYILVGIENTQRRRDLSGPTSVKTDKKIAPVVGESGNFRNFIDDELFAEINNRYRITTEKALIGESLAGLFVTETFLQHPEMFDRYIAFDPSLWWNNQSLIKTAKENLAKFPQTQKRFWFAGSSAKDIYKATNKLSETLEEAKPNQLKFHYSPEPNEQHNTIFRATKEKALIWALNND